MAAVARRLGAGLRRAAVAVFAPLSDIGLIVIDEEHESSYKHEGDPALRRAGGGGGARAGARRAAARRQRHAATRERSASEAVAARAGRRPAAAPGGGAGHARISIIRFTPNAAALADVARGGGKAIVLLNRRGWSNFLSCRACGHVWMCPNCEVALVLHRARGGRVPPLRASRADPARCRDCGSDTVARHGAGTERLEHELRAALGDDGLSRCSASMRTRRAVEARAPRSLERFAARRPGVLVGTQMVAKGHDFADVGLGVVLDADADAAVSRISAPRSGRSRSSRSSPGATGRGGSGRVLVQTMAPGRAPIVLAARHESERFLAGELGRREALGYPPVLLDHPDHVLLTGRRCRGGRRGGTCVRRWIRPPAAVLGPAPLFALRGRARQQIVVKAFERAPAVAAVAGAVDAFARGKRFKGVNVAVDVDPEWRRGLAQF